MNPKALNIARLWALAGCRRQDICELKWPEVDFENGLLVLKDTKTGQSIRPLPVAAMTLLHGIERAEESIYVFPSDWRDTFFQGTKTIWQKIVKRADLPGVTPHTLRHTVGAIATSNGEALALTVTMLGHANMRSTMIYAHVDRDPSVKAANRRSDQIAAAMSGQTEITQVSNVEAQADVGKSASNGLLPAPEWEMLLDLADADAGGQDYLCARACADLVVGASHQRKGEFACEFSLAFETHMDLAACSSPDRIDNAGIGQPVIGSFVGPAPIALFCHMRKQMLRYVGLRKAVLLRMKRRGCGHGQCETKKGDKFMYFLSFTIA